MTRVARVLVGLCALLIPLACGGKSDVDRCIDRMVEAGGSENISREGARTACESIRDRADG